MLFYQSSTELFSGATKLHPFPEWEKADRYFKHAVKIETLKVWIKDCL
jgi:hypothetical protein